MSNPSHALTGVEKPDPGVCARCASQSSTCCQISPGQEEFCFPLSEIEMDRIREFHPSNGWFAQEPNTAAFISHVARLFPGEEERVGHLFHPRKFHYRLAVDSSGACRLLTDAGCALPREARPYYCRLYPVWRVGEHFAMLGDACLARREARGTAHLLRSLGQSPAVAKDLHSRLRMAWGLPPQSGLPAARVSYARNNR